MLSGAVRVKFLEKLASMSHILMAVRCWGAEALGVFIAFRKSDEKGLSKSNLRREEILTSKPAAFLTGTRSPMRKAG